MFFFSEIFDRKITARLDGWEEKAKRLESKSCVRDRIAPGNLAGPLITLYFLLSFDDPVDNRATNQPLTSCPFLSALPLFSRRKKRRNGLLHGSFEQGVPLGHIDFQYPLKINSFLLSVRENNRDTSCIFVRNFETFAYSNLAFTKYYNRGTLETLFNGIILKFRFPCEISSNERLLSEREKEIVPWRFRTIIPGIIARFEVRRARE